MKLFAIGILIGLAIGVSLCKRKPPQAPCPEPTPENEKWAKRLDELDSFYAEEKAIDRMKRK